MSNYDQFDDDSPRFQKITRKPHSAPKHEKANAWRRKKIDWAKTKQPKKVNP